VNNEITETRRVCMVLFAEKVRSERDGQQNKDAERE